MLYPLREKFSLTPTRSTSSSINIGKSTGSQGQLMTTESMSSLSGSTTTIETTAVDHFPDDPVEENNAKNSLLDLVAASKSVADWTTNLPSGVIDSSPNPLPGRSTLLSTRTTPGTVHLTSSCRKSPTINSSPEVYKNQFSPSVKSAARVHANDSPPAARSTDW